MDEKTAKTIEIACDADSSGARLDKFLAEKIPDFTRSRVQKLIAEGKVFVNEIPAKGSLILKSSDIARVEVPEVRPLETAAEDIPIKIIYEDDDIIVVDKPRGMVVHPAPGNFSGTLVGALLHHCGKNLSGINGVARPGIVHRIDKDTTGLLVVAKNDAAHVNLAEQIKNHTARRIYLGLVCGGILEPGTVDKPIGRDPKNRKRMAVTLKNSRPAVTHYRPIEIFDKYTLIKFSLETGRTHQIRAHMKSISRPILGDALYGPEKNEFSARGQLLHAASLEFFHPKNGERVKFFAPIPFDFKEILRKIRAR
jgi:23S rRNA pseudouridine1911/1915/1917 synthase